VGEWTQKSESAFKLNATAPPEPGIYAFALDDIIVYIGLTNNSLRNRFEQYRRGHEGQRTNARVNKLIAKALSQGHKVKALMATPEPLEWHGLPVNTAAGLEASLIQMIRPPWNITGAV
jgi:excinuclease UvrABC nuclease subunit